MLGTANFAFQDEKTCMKVGIGTDHGGVGPKEELIAKVRAIGHEVTGLTASILMMTIRT